MAGPSVSDRSRPKALESIIEAGKKAFDPSADASSQSAGLQEYNELLERTETHILIPSLNQLVRPNVLPAWLREPLMQTLTHIPLRRDGVRGTMEFVFSVHPSNDRKPAGTAEPQKEGASITHEAVAVATRLLSSVPASMTAQAWFDGISGQLFSLMDGVAGPDLAKTAAQIVGFGILGKKQHGAPGAPGWNAFVQPLIQSINPSLKSDSDHVVDNDDEIVDLSRGKRLVTPQALGQAVRRLKVLILSNPSPGLCKRVLKPVLLQLWALASISGASPPAEENLCKPGRSLVQTYLTLFGNSGTITLLIQNLLCKGSSPTSGTKWKYSLTPGGEVELVLEQSLFDKSTGIELDWSEVDRKSATLVELVVTACSSEEISSTFLSLLRRWIQTTTRGQANLKIETSSNQNDPESPVQDLVQVTVLQKLLDKASEKLISHFDQLVDLVCQVLRADSSSPLEEDVIAVVLSLLNLIITAPSFQKSDITPEDLRIIETSLDRLAQQDGSETSITARNLGLLLKYRDEVEASDQPAEVSNARQAEDRKTYKLAMEYITGGGDNPPPVVSEGLNLLSGLILAESPILDITAITVLIANMLKDNEDYINLRVIKMFTQLANKHPRSTISELLDHYLDAQERSNTDTRLRFGEALLQVIERLGDTFTGDAAQQVSETLLSIAGRRGYRPKTLAKQLRDEKLRKLKGGRDGDAEDDEPLVDEELTEEEKAKNDVLAQILQGWESKRGSEDVRMRTSALSIFGSAIETNIGGVGPTRVSAGVDLCLNVLAMEPEAEMGILRRSAILVVLSFVKALDNAKAAGRKLGFGLTGESREDIVRTLEYIAATDNDGLVQQHAKDVIESLENWQMAGLLLQQDDTAAPSLTRLAGLHVNPAGNLVDGAGRPRPRIEEVE